MGAHYLGGYIGDDESKIDWMRERTLTWEKNTNTNTPNRVTPQWYMQYNQSGYFYNASPWVLGTRSREWRK